MRIGHSHEKEMQREKKNYCCWYIKLDLKATPTFWGASHVLTVRVREVTSPLCYRFGWRHLPAEVRQLARPAPRFSELRKISVFVPGMPHFCAQFVSKGACPLCLWICLILSFRGLTSTLSRVDRELSSRLPQPDPLRDSDLFSNLSNVTGPQHDLE